MSDHDDHQIAKSEQAGKSGRGSSTHGSWERVPFVVEAICAPRTRVSWCHHSDKMVSPIRQPEQFRDFATAEEAEDFAG